MRILPSVWSRVWFVSGLWFLGVIAPNVAMAQAPPIVCNASAVPATLRAGGVTERTSDVLLTCTGGFPTPTDATVLPHYFEVTLSEPQTSKDIGGWGSESLAIVDEPGASNQRACTDTEGCFFTGTGNGIGTYSGVPGRPNIYQGGADGQTIYYAFPFDPPGTGQRRIRFTNLRVDASALDAGTAVVARVSVEGQIPINITNSVVTVGTVQAPFNISVKNVLTTGGGISGFTVGTQELFSNALKARSPSGPLAGSQANPGGVSFDYETGFFNSTLPNWSGGNLGIAGLADTGTRVRLRVGPIGGNVGVSAPILINLMGGQARLISGGTFGDGPYAPLLSGALPVVNGVATALYEIIQSSGGAVETLDVPFVINSPSPIGTLSLNVAIAPMASATVQGATTTPRFILDESFLVTPPLTVPGKTLLSGAVGSAYQDSLSASGGLGPYTFAATGGSLPPGISLGSTGALTGNPTTPGAFRFDVTVTDNNQATASNSFSISVVGGSALGAIPTAVTFNAVQDGPAPLVQDVHVFSQPATIPQTFNVTIDNGTGGAAPSWLRVSLTSATTPAIVTVSVDQARMTPGTFNGRLRLAVANNPNLPPTFVPVTLVVTAATPKLEIAPNLLSFDASASSAGKHTGAFQVSNKGSGSILFSISVVNGSRWLTAVSAGSIVDPRNPVQVSVEADSTGLQPGIYRDILRVSSTACPVDQPQFCDIPVLLRVTPSAPRLTLDQTGLRFLQRPGASTPVTREVRLSSSEPGTPVSWTAEMMRGGEWFSLGSGAGTASQASPSSLKVNVRTSTSGLAAGRYYGLIRIDAPSAVNPTQYIVTVLQVSPATDPVEIDLNPGGVMFTGTARTAQQVRATVAMNVDSATPVAFQAAAATTDGAAWLSVTPASGNASLAQNQALTITADPRALNAGIYTGSVTVASGTTSRAVNVVFIVTDAASDAAPAPGIRAATCSPNRAAVASTGMPDNFSIPAGWPSTIAVQVRDNCGAAVNSATVVARFTNGDPPLTLDADDAPTGIYSATWQPGGVSNPMNVTISALTAAYPEAKAAIAGGVRENKVPTLARGGVVHPFDRQLGGLLAPGQPVEVYGAELAGTSEGTFVPLPPTFKGTNILIGPYDAPLFFVSPGQLNAQIPSELTPGRTYPIIVSANGAITIPDQLDIVGVQPGVAAFSDNTLIVQHGSDYSLVTPANPAKRGEFLIMYLVGLGATNPTVATGAASPSTVPLGQPTNAVTMTIDGSPVTPAFIGLTPGGVGLFQINFQVPSNARLNESLEVIVRQSGYAAKTTTLTVAQ